MNIMKLRTNSSILIRTIHLILTITVSVLGYDDYYAEYYDVDLQPPTFTSKSQFFTVELGQPVTIPCDAENQGDYKLVIKKKNSNGKEQLLWVGREKMARTKRLHLDAHTLRLTISQIRVTDAGTYICNFGTNPPMELQHHVDVLYPPVVSLSVSPKQRVRVGTSVTFTCATRGNPEPTISWAKREEPLDHLHHLQQPLQQLVLPEVTPASTGTYVCTAANELGHSSSASATLIVEYPPTVSTDKHSVRSGEGDSLELVCLVAGEPKPLLTWAHDGNVITRELDTNGFKGFHKSSKYYMNTTLQENSSVESIRNNIFKFEQNSLKIENIEEADFGTYVCRAENQFGKDYVTIQVTGLPHSPHLTSEPESNYYNSYTFTWESETYYPIMELVLKYKTKQFYTTLIDESWERIRKITDLERSSSPMVMSDIGYSNDDRKTKSAYTNKQIDASIYQTKNKHSIMNYVSLTIHNLKAGVDYISSAKVRNKYGWSLESEVFTFSTKKGRPMAIHQSSNSSYKMGKTFSNLLYTWIVSRLL